MKANPYLIFDGRCAEALGFYAKILGGKVGPVMTYGASEGKMHTDPSWHDKVMHMDMTAGEVVLMGSDSPPAMYEKPAGTSVALHLDEAAEAQRIFKALSDGANITMPIQETFWAKAFGMLTDRYGTPWIINGAPIM